MMAILFTEEDLFRDNFVGLITKFLKDFIKDLEGKVGTDEYPKTTRPIEILKIWGDSTEKIIRYCGGAKFRIDVKNGLFGSPKPELKDLKLVKFLISKNALFEKGFIKNVEIFFNGFFYTCREVVTAMREKGHGWHQTIDRKYFLIEFVQL